MGQGGFLKVTRQHFNLKNCIQTRQLGHYYRPFNSHDRTHFSQRRGTMNSILRGIVLVFLSLLLFVGISAAASLHYTYDEQNRLICVENPEKYRIEYSYDAAGNRISKKVTFLSVSFDSDHDGDVDGQDLFAFTGSWDGSSEKLADFAAVFGTK